MFIIFYCKSLSLGLLKQVIILGITFRNQDISTIVILKSSARSHTFKNISKVSFAYII